MTAIEYLQDAPGRSTALKLAAAFAFCLSGLLPTAGAHATPVVPSATFGNEVNFLEYTIDHHFSALRMTELAAGTDVVGSTSGYAGSAVTFPATGAKGTDPVVLSVATMANAAQRMEINEAEGFLQKYDGISGYQPFVLPENQPLINTLDQAAPGDPFNIAFLETFSQHHAELLPPAQECVALDVHADVQAYCSNLVASQTRQINQMQTELRDAYGINGGVGTSVPEPASAAVLTAGLLGLGVALRGKQRV